MAKFCTKCGSPIEEGQKCKCESVEKASTTVKEVSTAKFNVVDLLKEYLEVVKKIFIKPIDTLKEYSSEDNFNLSLVTIAIFGIIMGIFICVAIKNILGAFSSFVDIPYVKVFIFAFLGGIATIAIMALIAYVIADKFFKGETTIKKMFVLFGLTSIILDVTVLLAMIATLISLDMNIVYLIIGAGSILSLAYSVKSLENYTKLNINSIGYVMTITSIVSSVIVYYLITEILVKILV